MKKQMIRASLLVLAVLAVVLIHKRVQYEAEEAEKLTSEAMEQSAVLSEEVQQRSILRAGAGVELGVMTENTERGGVDVTVTGADGTQTTYTFTDVAIDSWYADAVNFVVSAGLMNGSAGDSLFRPEYGMLRESFALAIYRFAGGDPPETRVTFEDVADGQWYQDAIGWVVNEGLLMPAEENVFGVGKYMTCEQAIVGLYRLAGEPETDGSLADYPYAAKVSGYGRSAMDWAWKNGLITEVECVWYPPQTISRAQLALLLERFSKKIS